MDSTSRAAGSYKPRTAILNWSQKLIKDCDFPRRRVIQPGIWLRNFGGNMTGEDLKVRSKDGSTFVMLSDKLMQVGVPLGFTRYAADRHEFTRLFEMGYYNIFIFIWVYPNGYTSPSGTTAKTSFFKTKIGCQEFGFWDTRKLKKWALSGRGQF